MNYWTQAVDLYCERLGPGFWAEPVNAVSNVAFVIAGLWALHLACKQKREADIWLQILCIWGAVIGVGSFLFHTLANRWSELADIIPIWSFIAVYVVFVLRRMFELEWPVIGISAAVSLAVVALVMVFLPEGSGEGTNQSTQYIPAVLALAAFAAVLLWSRHPAALLVVAACAVFALSLFFRSVDLAVCDTLPLGTHFLWHLLNGTMVGLLLLVAVRYGQSDFSRNAKATS